MYQAIDAILKDGVIQALEPVQFEENEHLVILRLFKSWKSKKTIEPAVDWKHLAGMLKASPNLNDNPLLIQQEMRNEWD